MNAVLLAGGTGTRLSTITGGANKHRLMMSGLPMLIRAMIHLNKAGVTRIFVVVDKPSKATFVRMFERYRKFVGPEVSFVSQLSPDGIVHGLLCCQDQLEGMPFLLSLADNVYDQFPAKAIRRFWNKPEGALTFNYKSSTPDRFAVANIKKGRIVSVEEKPKNPSSSLVLVGLYAFDGTGIERARKVCRSVRGEFEIVDLLRSYLADGLLESSPVAGRWVDAGSGVDAFHEALTITRHG